MKRRNFLLASTGVAGNAIVSAVRAAQPCPPLQVGVAGGNTVITSCPTSMPTSALGTMASSMAAGTWAQLSPAPSGLGNFIGGSVSGIRTGFSTKMAFDPASRRIYYIGCDHAQAQIFHQYDEASNAWTILTPTPFGAPTKHGYEHSTFDTLHGKLYHRPYGTNGIYRWDGGGNWTFVDYSASLNYPAAANGVAFFKELGANGSIIVYQDENGTNGKVIGIDPVTQKVTIYASGTTLSGSGDPHNFAQYSPTQQIVWFGGGNGSSKNWKINSAGAVSALVDTPAALGQIGPADNCALPVCNPATGSFLVIKNSTTWYDFNPSGSGSFTARGGTATPWASNVFDSSQPMFGTVACPIHDYGVIVFIKAYNASNPAQMWLYKP